MIGSALYKKVFGEAKERTKKLAVLYYPPAGSATNLNFHPAA
jgi:hypothetical protein